MPDSQLQPIDHFHHELKSLAAAGIPVKLGIVGDEQQLNSALDDIRASLRVRVSLGQTLQQAIQQDERLPERYRAVAQAWLTIDTPAMVLDAATEAEPLDLRWDRSIALSLLQTLVTLVMATIGMFVASLWLSPKVDAIYRQLNQTPTAAARFLAAAREGVPIWATAATAALVSSAWLWYRHSHDWARRWAAYLPMIRRRQLMVNRARFADYLANWLQHDLPLADGIRLATALSGNVSPGADAAAHDGSVPKTADAQSTDTPQNLVLPPLINWAVHEQRGDEPVASRLRAVADVYRAIADRQLAQWVRYIPMIAAAGLCGLAVLMYGMGVFLPVIGLLKDVAAPQSF